ncbi:hypothetical protein ACFSKS_15495 [Pseudocitrobacter faecalis]
MMNDDIFTRFLYIKFYLVLMVFIDANFIFDGVEGYCFFYSFNELFFQILVVNNFVFFFDEK